MKRTISNIVLATSFVGVVTYGVLNSVGCSDDNNGTDGSIPVDTGRGGHEVTGRGGAGGHGGSGGEAGGGSGGQAGGGSGGHGGSAGHAGSGIAGHGVVAGHTGGY